MYEKSSSTIYDNYIIEIVNKVLAETYNENNMMRMFKGKLPFIDGIGAHQAVYITRTYLTKHGAGPLPNEDPILMFDFELDDDMSKMSVFQTEYNNARVSNQCMVSDERVKELTEKAYAVPTV